MGPGKHRGVPAEQEGRGLEWKPRSEDPPDHAGRENSSTWSAFGSVGTYLRGLKSHLGPLSFTFISIGAEMSLMAAKLDARFYYALP